MITSLIAFAGMLEQSEAPITFLGGIYVHKSFQSMIDPKSKTILYSDSGCDGSIVQAYLSRDIDSIMCAEGYGSNKNSDYWIDSKETLLSSLKPTTISTVTNRGIRLGMTPRQVTSILGKPTYIVNGKKVPGKQYIYRWTKPKLGEYDFPRDCKNFYVFRKGRLEYIEFNSSSIGGG